MAMRTKAVLKALVHYKSFIAGVAILVFFIGLSIYAAVTWPYEKAIAMWNDPSYWQDYPEWAPPSWIQLFTGKKEIEGSLVIDSETIARRYISKVREVEVGLTRETITIEIPFDYDVFPRSGRLELVPVAEGELGRGIGAKVVWVKPSGINITLFSGVVPREGATIGLAATPELHPVLREYRRALYIAYNKSVNVEAIDPVKALFIDDEAFVNYNQTKVLKGTYKLICTYVVVEGLKSLRVKLMLRGTVYGLLGTDFQGRDLFMGVAWGAPIAMSFGLLASVLTTILIMIIAAVVAWFRGLVDEFVSRVNEIFMILPFLPTLILIMLFYGFTIWTLLLVVVVLSVLGSGGLKTQRAMFLQIREMPYIEAARAYGASSFRIVFRYMVPRVLPVLIPNIVISVPSFVFLEAALALLGLSDPRTITWGKILEEALDKAALFQGAYHWVLGPSFALVLLSVAFAMIGFTLDRVFNPRLRQL